MENLKQMLATIDLNRLLTIFDIQIAIGTILFFIIFRTAFARLIIKICYKLTKNKKVAKESEMNKLLSGFFVILGLYLAVRILNTNEQLGYYATLVFKLIVIYCIAKTIAGQLYMDSYFMNKALKDKNQAVDKLVCKILRVILWIIVFFIDLAVLGFDVSKFGGLVTGLGIVSAVAALAAQDLVKSLISGFIIITDKPFVLGDWIEVGDYEGTVIDITFRSVRIKAYNNAIVTIPNSMITETYILNWNRLTNRRFDCTLGLSLDTSAEKVRKIIKEIRVVLQNNENIIRDTVQVTLNDITTGSINIKIYLYINKVEFTEFLRVKQDIYCDLLYLMEKENIDLVAYPTQTVYLNNKEDEVE